MKQRSQRVQELEAQVAALTRYRETAKQDLLQQQNINEALRREHAETVNHMSEREKLLKLKLGAVQKVLQAALTLAEDAPQDIIRQWTARG